MRFIQKHHPSSSSWSRSDLSNSDLVTQEVTQEVTSFNPFKRECLSFGKLHFDLIEVIGIVVVPILLLMSIILLILAFFI